jgi:hypothetical protein
MKNLHGLLVVAFLLLFLQGTMAAPTKFSQKNSSKPFSLNPLNQSLVFLDCIESNCTENAIDLLEASGYSVDHIFHPDTLIVHKKKSFPQKIVSLDSIKGIKVKSIHSTLIPQKTINSLKNSKRFAALAFNKMISPKTGLPENVNLSDKVIFPKPIPFSTKGESSINSTSSSPKTSSTQYDWLPYGADLNDTSEFFLGTILVFIILPYCDGTGPDTCTETWTQQEIDTVKADIPTAMNWWIQVKNDHNVSGPLSFVYIPLPDAYSEPLFPTGHEPIQHDPFTWNPSAPCERDDFLWMDEVLSVLGAPGECEQKAINFINSQRELWAPAYHPDWGFIVYAVDAPQGGNFPFGGRAYAELGGPFAVVADPHFGVDAITAHETGHIFYALDEYSSSNCYCTQQSGYIYYENQNCESSCAIDVESIMKDIETAYPLYALDYYAAGMIGWNDDDSDGIPQVLDTFPDANFLFDEYTTQDFNYLVHAVVQPLQRSDPTKNNITLNTIFNAKFKISQTPAFWLWAGLDPVDGAYDEPEEDLNAWAWWGSPVSPGWHTMDLYVDNSVGNRVYFSKDFYVLFPQCTTDADCGSGYCRTDYFGQKYCVSSTPDVCTDSGVEISSQGLFSTDLVFKDSMTPPWCAFGHWSEDPFISSTPGKGTTFKELSLSAGTADTSTQIKLPLRATISSAKLQASGKAVSGSGLIDSFEDNTETLSIWIPPSWVPATVIGEEFIPQFDYTLTEAYLWVYSTALYKYDTLYIIDRENSNAILSSVSFTPVSTGWVGGVLSSPVNLQAGHKYALVTKVPSGGIAYCYGVSNSTPDGVDTIGATSVSGPYTAYTTDRCSYKLYGNYSSTPSNVEIDVGGNGSIEWTYSGELTEGSGPQTVSFASELQNLIQRCNCPLCSVESGTYCKAGISVKSDTSGTVALDNLAIEYEEFHKVLPFPFIPFMDDLEGGHDFR